MIRRIGFALALLVLATVGASAQTVIYYKQSSGFNPVPVSVGTPLPVTGNFTTNPNSYISNPSANFSRQANTTQYAVGQLVANSSTAGSVVPLSWTTPAQYFRIVRVQMELSSKSVTNTNFRIHFFNASPGVQNGDLGTFDPTLLADEVCEMDVTIALAGNDVSKGYGAANQGTACYVNLGANIMTLYALIEARAAYTPGSAETITVIPELD